MAENDALQRELTAAILQLRIRSPFFAALALFARMHIVETLPTAATDGRDILINPQFWQSLKPAERLGLVTHEVLHAALLHIPRGRGRDHLLWNIAADIVINGMILAQEGFELPQGHLRDKELEHLSVEEVYHILQTNPQRCPRIQLSDLLWPTIFDADADTALDAYWRQALQQAQILADMLGHGTRPAGLQREMAQLSPAQLDWRSYLWRFLVQTPVDFEGFDRRFIWQRLYLDTIAGESVRVYVGVDTSGSISQQLLGQFLGEVRGILGSYPHLVATLYYVDAACDGPYPLVAGDEALPASVGGGGTDFRPFFEAVEKEHDSSQPAICVYLTDGYGTFPDEAPAMPVLWVLSPGGLDVARIPFGEAVRLIPS